MLNKSKIRNELYINQKKEIDNLSQTNQIQKSEYDRRLKELLIADRKLTKEQGSFGKFVAKYYIKFKNLSIPMVILIIFGVGCSLMLPLMTQQMSFGIARKFGFGGTPGNQDWGLDWQVSMWIAIGVTAFNLVLMFFTQYLAWIISNKVEIELRTEALNSLVKQDISYYSNKKTGELLTKIISDTQIVGEQTTQVPVTMIQTVLTILGTLGMMFYFDWRLTFIVIGIFVCIMVFMGLFYGMVRTKINEVRTVVSDINGDITDRINNIRLIKSSGTEKHEMGRFKKLHKRYSDTNRSMVKYTSTFMTVIFGGISILQLGVVIGAVLIYQNDRAGAMVFFSSTFASFTLALGAMIGSLFQTVMVSVGIAKGSVSAVRVNQIIVAKPLIDIYDNLDTKVDRVDGDIIFENVEFAYPEKPGNVILPNFNFKMEKGKSYAIVGATGSGKSTIAKLLLRYYDPTKGKIFINNTQDLRGVNLTSYLEHVGYVEQEPSILYGNVFDNVRYGKFDVTDEQIITACQKAELDDLIKSWPEGYNTILGERGMMLSGGQKQRLVIARMFLKDPNLLILDEATSALDNIVEKEIQQQLNKLMQGRTTVAIAHRLSTIKDADQIIVLGSNGQGIVQVGTFDELKQLPGHFKNLYEAGLMQ